MPAVHAQTMSAHMVLACIVAEGLTSARPMALRVLQLKEGGVLSFFMGVFLGESGSEAFNVLLHERAARPGIKIAFTLPDREQRAAVFLGINSDHLDDDIALMLFIHA